jgi:hypothetical protein
VNTFPDPSVPYGFFKGLWGTDPLISTAVKSLDLLPALSHFLSNLTPGSWNPLLS